MSFSATVIADSIGDDAPRLTTFELVYPRFIHAELMTHRVFSRNASSSRAIPVPKMLADITADPAMPAEWRMNESGMQGFTVASDTVVRQAEALWKATLSQVVQVAEQMVRLGLHKQHINRLLEPWAHIRVVVTATQWANWYGLRDHPDAEPSIQKLAALMKEAQDASTPTKLARGEWHLPYVTGDDDAIAAITDYANTASVLDLDAKHIRSDDRKLTAIEVSKRVSAARCARTSYKTFDGKPSTVPADFDLFDKLVAAELIHASPTEHQASPDVFLTKGKRWMSANKHGNLNGWIQFRKELPNENLDTVIGEVY